MSLATWKKEFYNVSADKCLRKDAVQHSIQKWTGLLAPNLKKHGLKIVDSGIADKAIRDAEGNKLEVDASTCALCRNYSCWECPLELVRDGVACCYQNRKELRSPYDTFLVKGRADHMLRWLKKI